MLRFDGRLRDCGMIARGVLLTWIGARSEEPPRPLKPKMLRFLSLTEVGPVAGLLPQFSAFWIGVALLGAEIGG